LFLTTGIAPIFVPGRTLALADRAPHVCKAAVVWWDDRGAFSL
jgi:hypothetical protein